MGTLAGRASLSGGAARSNDPQRLTSSAAASIELPSNSSRATNAFGPPRCEGTRCDASSSSASRRTTGAAQSGGWQSGWQGGGAADEASSADAADADADNWRVSGCWGFLPGGANGSTSPMANPPFFTACGVPSRGRGRGTTSHTTAQPQPEPAW